jgi:hypothetical protein
MMHNINILSQRGPRAAPEDGSQRDFARQYSPPDRGRTGAAGDARREGTQRLAQPGAPDIKILRRDAEKNSAARQGPSPQSSPGPEQSAGGARSVAAPPKSTVSLNAKAGKDTSPTTLRGKQRSFVAARCCAAHASRCLSALAEGGTLLTGHDRRLVGCGAMRRRGRGIGGARFHPHLAVEDGALTNGQGMGLD